jgi:hypothetical protein
MSILVIDEDAVTVKHVECQQNHLIVTLSGGQEIRTPLWHYPRLLNATPAQRQNYEIMPMGIHWPDVDEDLSINGILQGTKAPGAVAQPPLPNPSA